MKLRTFLFLLVGLFVFSLNSFSKDDVQSEQSFSNPYYIELTGEVTPGLAAYIGRALDDALEGDADLICIGIDTPGGRVDSALKLIEHIEEVDSVPVYAYVEDMAWSAGAMISLACERIYMRESSSIGSATPVSAGGGQAHVLGEKYVSAIRAKFRALAERNGYNVDLAAAMVDKDIEIYKVQYKDEPFKVMTLNGLEDYKKDVNEKHLSSELISAEGKLVNLSAKEGFALGLVSGVYKNVTEFKDALKCEKTFERIGKNALEKAVGFLTSGAVSSLLLTLGLMCIYIELQSPGMGVAGILGVSLLGVFFGGHYLIEYAQMLDVILFFCGIALILMEIFVVPGFGVTGIAGGICILAGLFMAFIPSGFSVNPWKMPPWEWDLVMSSGVIVMGSLLGSFILSLTVVASLHRIPILKNLVLTTDLRDEKENDSMPRDTDLPEVGSEGFAETTLRPVGKGLFNGKLYDVISEHGVIEKKSLIKVIRVEGNNIVVKR